MGVRLPLTTVLDVTNTSLGASSVAGGTPYTFKIPQDSDSVIVKFMPSVVGGGLKVFLQTSDDGGTTYYDVACSSALSAANTTTAQWIAAPVVGPGMQTGVIQAASVLTTGIGSAAASSLGARQISGLPILGLQNRVFLVSNGNHTVNDGSRIIVYVNSQDSGH